MPLVTVWYKFKYVSLQDENPNKMEGTCFYNANDGKKSHGKIKKKNVRKQERIWLEKKNQTWVEVLEK